MSALFAVFGDPRGRDIDLTAALAQSDLLSHRGPDYTGYFRSPGAVLVHHRLATVDPHSGPHPLLVNRGRRQGTALAFCGEIYNHKELRRCHPEYPFASGTDGEVILNAYARLGVACIGELQGDFAFALYDETRGRYLIARDPMGVEPLFWGRDDAGTLYVASEMKALVSCCSSIEVFPPGHILHTEIDSPRRYFASPWTEPRLENINASSASQLRSSFERAVQRRLSDEVPYGIPLSGGLDSALIAAIAQRSEHTTGPKRDVATFSIGLQDSPDLEHARATASALGTKHTEVVFTLEEGRRALGAVIRHIESYDVETVRAAVPMYLLAEQMARAGIKVALSGEGADEAFGGYLYFYKAPNAAEFHRECVRKIHALHQFGGLLANKALAAWGVEARLPFSDLDFLRLAMTLDPTQKLCSEQKLEKHVLRACFEDLLPASVLWRRKAQLAEGVGHAWVESLQAYASQWVSISEFRNAAQRFPFQTPQTREAYLYRSIFEQHFPGQAAASVVPTGPSFACSTPLAMAWDPGFAANPDAAGHPLPPLATVERASLFATASRRTQP